MATINQQVLYAPCPCGSGKKFKFCCYKTYRDKIEADMTLADVTQLVRLETSSQDADGEANPEAYRLHCEGVDLLCEAKFAEAREKFRRSRELVPNYAASWNNEASCTWEMGDYAAAFELQCEGNAKASAADAFGLGSLAFYAHTTGHEDEALKALDAAVNVLPRSIYGANQTCKALALYHRHRDILDYVAKSGMTDSPKLSFFTGVAHANLGELAEARRDFERAYQGEFEEEAEAYLDCLDKDCDLWEAPPGEDVWMYFTSRSFAPARFFMDDVESGKDPLVACPPAVALDCVCFLFAEGRMSVEEAIDLARRVSGPRAEKLIETLSLAKEALKASLREEDARRKRDVDAQGRERIRICDMQSECGSDELEDEEVSVVNDALGLAATEGRGASDDEITTSINTLAILARKYPDSSFVQAAYCELLRLRDPELAQGLLAHFVEDHPYDSFALSHLIFLAIKRKDWPVLNAVVDRIAVPEEPLELSDYTDILPALACLGVTPGFAAACPDATHRLAQILKPVVYHGRSA